MYTHGNEVCLFKKDEANTTKKEVLNISTVQSSLALNWKWIKMECYAL